MHHAVRYQTGHRPAASLHRFRHCKLRTDLLWTRNGQMACIFRPRSVESAVRDHAVIQSGVEHTITWSWVRRPNDYNGCRNWPQIFSACHISTHVDDCALRLHQRGRSTHCAFYHWRPHFSSDCCVSLEQFAGVSPVIAVVASFPQQTGNWTFCLVLQTWLRTSHCTDYYYVTLLFRLIVTCPCSLRT